MESLYVHLGLSNNQEFTISETVSRSIERILTLLEETSLLDHIFAGVVQDLTTAAAYTVDQDEDALPMVELW